MKEELSMKTIFIEIACTFFVATITMSLAGYFINDPTVNESSLYVAGGLRFSAIFQLIFYAVCSVILHNFCLSYLILKKTSYMMRSVLYIILVWIMTMLFTYSFQWFVIDDMSGWILFNLSFFGSFAICGVVFGFLFRNKEKRYAQLLADYKNRKEIDKNEGNHYD